MKVPAKCMALGLALLLCAGALTIAGGQPGRAVADSLQVMTEAEQVASGQVELRISWHWKEQVATWRWKLGEQLLAVSFDTRQLVVEHEEAPLGKGANGVTLQRLERVAGPDGARRLFVIPEGQDGYVRLRFRSVFPDLHGADTPFHVYVVFDHPTADVWRKETTVGALG